MMTVRQIEKRWNAQAPARLVDDLLAARSEDSPRLRRLLSRPMAAAAMALIRLDELNQAHTPLAGKLLKHILASQEADGGWESPAITAICVRALLRSGGHGLAIDRGIQSLATLQKDDGLWPAISIRRTEADPFASAFILFSLGDCPAFRAAVRFSEALAWFEAQGHALPPDTHQLFARATARCRSRLPMNARLEHPATLWS